MWILLMPCLQSRFLTQWLWQGFPPQKVGWKTSQEWYTEHINSSQIMLSPAAKQENKYTYMRILSLMMYKWAKIWSIWAQEFAVVHVVLEAFSIKRCLTGIRNPIIKTRQSHDHLVFYNGNPNTWKGSLYIEVGPLFLLLGLLSWWRILKSSHSNSFEDLGHLHFTEESRIFKSLGNARKT